MNCCLETSFLIHASLYIGWRICKSSSDLLLPSLWIHWVCDPLNISWNSENLTNLYLINNHSTNQRNTQNHFIFLSYSICHKLINSSTNWGISHNLVLPKNKLSGVWGSHVLVSLYINLTIFSPIDIRKNRG